MNILVKWCMYYNIIFCIGMKEFYRLNYLKKIFFNFIGGWKINMMVKVGLYFDEFFFKILFLKYCVIYGFKFNDLIIIKILLLF